MIIDKFMLDREDTVFLIVDIQEKLATVMKEKDKVVRNNQHLIELAKMTGMPVLVTEQYPKGLGPTVLPELKDHNRNTVILTGMETHICVLQTCIGLLKGGINVHVVQDAVCSRTKDNWKTGIEYMREAGAVVTCTETVLFQLLKKAGTEEFKTISRRIK